MTCGGSIVKPSPDALARRTAKPARGDTAASGREAAEATRGPVYRATRGRRQPHMGERQPQHGETPSPTRGKRQTPTREDAKPHAGVAEDPTRGSR
jgi:hypothetical protein